MRTLTGNALVLTGIAAGIIAASCGTPCEDTHSCGTFNPTGGSGGSAAAAGAAGKSGASGHSGAGTGVGGSSAEGGQAGSDGGTAALGGSAGASAAGSGGGGNGGGAGSAGMENGGQGGAAPTCDDTKSPVDEACLVSNEYAIFVSPSGDDGGSGKKTDPVKTLAKALSLAHDAGKVVIACSSAGSFSEQLSVTDALDGSRLYGGFHCDTWKYDASQKTTLSSPETTALRIDNLTDGMTIEDFAFEAADATTAGGSSVGAFVTSSKGVVFRRVSITAGKGAAGANGEGTSTPAATGATGNNGTDACMVESGANLGGAAVTSTCDGMQSESVGGKGGFGGDATNASGGNGDDGQVQPVGGSTGGGGVGETTLPAPGWSCDIGAGHSGANGTSQSAATGASTVGTLTSSGFTGTPGQDGESGTPGQGGGGGGGAKAPASCTNGNRTGASGGSGGGGGCGGKGGTGGKAGGSSIALALLDSKVTLGDDVELVSKDAGKGGDGGVGQPGGSGGKAGSAGVGGLVGVNDACDGGKGGRGGDGGSGGGAAGGISVGILWHGGSAPTSTGVKFTEGTPGAKGLGGSVGVNDGIVGVAQDVLPAP